MFSSILLSLLWNQRVAVWWRRSRWMMVSHAIAVLFSSAYWWMRFHWSLWTRGGTGSPVAVPSLL